VLYIERGSPPFILFQGWFQGELYMETLVTDVGRVVEIFPPKLGVSGSRPGSAEPGGRPTPSGAALAPPSRGRLAGGSIS
jgi:hypothetical protein